MQIVQESFPEVMLSDQDFLNHAETRETFMKMVPESMLMLAGLTDAAARHEAATRGPVEERRGIAIEREMVRLCHALRGIIRPGRLFMCGAG